MIVYTNQTNKQTDKLRLLLYICRFLPGIFYIYVDSYLEYFISNTGKNSLILDQFSRSEHVHSPAKQYKFCSSYSINLWTVINQVYNELLGTIVKQVYH